MVAIANVHEPIANVHEPIYISPMPGIQPAVNLSRMRQCSLVTVTMVPHRNVSTLGIWPLLLPIENLLKNAPYVLPWPYILRWKSQQRIIVAAYWNP